MSSTYFSLYYHIIFSTKDRKPSIATAWRTRLHEYLAGTIKGLEGIPVAVGGIDDHVHLDVNRYITNQEEHHRKKPFREELIELLQRAGIQFDPKYLD